MICASVYQNIFDTKVSIPSLINHLLCIQVHTTYLILFCSPQFVLLWLKPRISFTGPNIARGKPASQWPGQFINAAAGNAVDGDTSVDVRALDRCAYTRQGTKTHPAWWNVDLGTTYAITGLKIYNIDRHGKKVSFRFVFATTNLMY